MKYIIELTSDDIKKICAETFGVDISDVQVGVAEEVPSTFKKLFSQNSGSPVYVPQVKISIDEEKFIERTQANGEKRDK